MSTEHTNCIDDGLKNRDLRSAYSQSTIRGTHVWCVLCLYEQEISARYCQALFSECVELKSLTSYVMVQQSVEYYRRVSLYLKQTPIGVDMIWRVDVLPDMIEQDIVMVSARDRIGLRSAARRVGHVVKHVSTLTPSVDSVHTGEVHANAKNLD